jgi:O-antigen ligase
MPATSPSVVAAATPVPVAQTPDAAGKSRVRREPAGGYDLILQRIFCAWLFFQCFYYPALPWAHLNLGINITPDKLALAAMLLIFAAHLTRWRPPQAPRPAGATAVGRLLLTFTFVTLLSWWAHGGDAANPNFGLLTRAFNVSFFPALAYYLASNIRFSRSIIAEQMKFLAAVGVYLGVTAIAEHYGVGLLVFPKYILDPSVGIQVGRSRGPFVNTIGNGGMLLLTFLAFSWLAASLNGVKRLAAALLTLLAVAAVYFTETRSVWLGLAVIVGTFLLLRTSLRRTGLTIVALLLVIFLAGVGSKFSVSDTTLFSRRQNTVDYRLDNFQIGWNAFTANPLFGVGFGRFRIEWLKYADLKNSRRGIGLDDGNHSTFFGVLAELGLTGAVPFVALVGGAVIVVLSAYRRLGHPDAIPERRLAVVAIGALQIFLVLGLTSDLNTSPTVNIAAFWYVGVINSVATHWRKSQQAMQPDGPGRRVPGAFSRRGMRAWAPARAFSVGRRKPSDRRVADSLSS